MQKFKSITKYWVPMLLYEAGCVLNAYCVTAHLTLGSVCCPLFDDHLKFNVNTEAWSMGNREFIFFTNWTPFLSDWSSFVIFLLRFSSERWEQPVQCRKICPENHWSETVTNKSSGRWQVHSPVCASGSLHANSPCCHLGVVMHYLLAEQTAIPNILSLWQSHF